MAQAATTLVPIYVDCTNSNPQSDELAKRYNVQGFPTVLFLDSNGTKVEELASRAAAGMRDQIARIVQAHSRPTISDSTLEEGLTLAREQGKLLAVAFMDQADPESAALLDLVLTPAMEPMRGRFHWIRRPFSGERAGRASDEAKAHGARKAPTLILLDPWAETEDARELKKVTSFRSLRRDLEKVVEDAQKKGHPPAAGEATPPPPAEDGE